MTLPTSWLRSSTKLLSCWTRSVSARMSVFICAVSTVPEEAGSLGGCSTPLNNPSRRTFQSFRNDRQDHPKPHRGGERQPSDGDVLLRVAGNRVPPRAPGPVEAEPHPTRDWLGPAGHARMTLCR